jgi:ABC-type transporter Mla subunit MlaD
MSYQDELNRLQIIITSDNSTEAQRDAARQAKDKLIDNSIDEAFASFEDRTEEFNALIGRLGKAVDDIAANQLTGVIETIDGVVSDVQKAASGQD